METEFDVHDTTDYLIEHRDDYRQDQGNSNTTFQPFSSGSTDDSGLPVRGIIYRFQQIS